MESDHKEKLKLKDDQLLKESGQLEINTQDKIWRLLTNMPMSSIKKTSIWKENIHKDDKIHIRGDL